MIQLIKTSFYLIIITAISMSETGNGVTSGIQTNTESENVLDDLMQNFGQ